MTTRARWRTGEYAELVMRRRDYTIHQDSRRQDDSERWALCSQLIHEDDVVAVRLARGVKTVDLHDTAGRHVVDLEKEMDLAD